MAKLDPKDLRDDPVGPTERRERYPGELTHTQKVVARIKGMLVDGSRYEYAESTLRGILASIERTERVTPNQETAIDNIERAPNRAEQRDRNRRGW